MTAFSVLQKSGDFFFLLDPQVIHTRTLSGNMLSALVSSSFQRLSAALRRHSLAKTVHFASLSLLGLIRSFHLYFS